MDRRRRQRGFTLIEVMVVLALAAIIIVLIILSVNGAQIARRDAARKDAVNRFIAALIQTASHNNGAYPYCGPLSPNPNNCTPPDGFDFPSTLVLGACYCVGHSNYIEWGTVSNPNPAKNCNATSTTIGYALIYMESDGSPYCRTY